MVVVVKLVQVLLLVAAAIVGAAFIMALGSQDTGPLEKVALLVLAAVCMWGGFVLPRLATRLLARRNLY